LLHHSTESGRLCAGQAMGAGQNLAVRTPGRNLTFYAKKKKLSSR
jgi:hypothetical protein